VDELDIDKLEKEKQYCAKRLHSLDLDHKTQTEVVNNLKSEITRFQENVERFKTYSKEIEELAKYEFGFKELDRIITQSKTTILKGTLNKIINQTNLILKQISDTDLILSAKIEETTKTRKLKIEVGSFIKRTYHALSGGEKAIVNIAFHLGIGNLLVSVDGVKPRFLFLDEVFAPIDELKKSEIMKVIHFLKSQYDQIFIISHDSGLYDVFEHNITVVKGEVSHVKVA
jgi:DNA repair exonuclease SbcCD ATPase subunit